MCGNSLYGIISQSINKSYLLLTDVPEFVDIDNHAFNLQYSNSRDVFGRPSALGYCVLISVEGMENLGKYFRLTSRSNVVIPFELKGVTCIAAELPAGVITNSGMVGSTEVFEQQ